MRGFLNISYLKNIYKMNQLDELVFWGLELKEKEPQLSYELVGAIANQKYFELLEVVSKLKPETVMNLDKKLKTDIGGSWQIKINDLVENLREATIVNRRYGGVFNENETYEGRKIYGSRLRVLAYYQLMTDQNEKRSRKDFPDHK
jgi:hypothetical protein